MAEVVVKLDQEGPDSPFHSEGYFAGSHSWYIGPVCLPVCHVVHPLNSDNRSKI